MAKVHVTPESVWDFKKWKPKSDRVMVPGKPRPQGYYVYMWFDGDIPFYIGRGVVNRGLARHASPDGTLTRAEVIRRESTNFRCAVLRHYLSGENSFTLRNELVQILQIHGDRRVPPTSEGKQEARARLETLMSQAKDLRRRQFCRFLTQANKVRASRAAREARTLTEIVAERNSRRVE